MIKYRQLYFWIAAAIATASVGLAQTSPGQPTAAPSDAKPASKVAKPAVVSAKAGREPGVTTAKAGSEPAVTTGKTRSDPAVTTQAAATDSTQPTPASRVTTTHRKATATQKAVPTADPTEPASRISIIEPTPDTQKSEVIRQDVEILENQGVAKQSTSDAASTTSPSDITAIIVAHADTKSDDVNSLIKSLQEHGAGRLSLTVSKDDRNVVTVLAPANTPWPVIDNIRRMVTAKKLFAVDVQIATPVQPSMPTRIGTYSSGGARRYGYSSTKLAGGAPNKSLLDKAADVATAAEAAQPGTPNRIADSRPPQETRVFMLRYADAAIIAQGVSQLFDKNFGIAPDVRTNAVMVRGAAS